MKCKTKSMNPYLSGQSLIYALLITLLISVLLSSYLITENLLGSHSQNWQSDLETWDALRSVLLMSLNRESVPGREGIEIQKENWGLFGLVHIEARQAKNQNISALYGQKPGYQAKLSLWLADQGMPLVMKGRSQIRGKVQVPGGEIKISSHENRDFTGSLPFSWNLLPSAGTEIPYRLRQRRWIAQKLDSLAGLPESGNLHWEKGLVHQQAWDTLTWSLVHRGNLVLEGLSLEGRVLVMASESIRVLANCQLEHVLLIAPKIEIEKSFQGTLQAFARDTLRLADDCRLHFPSVLAVFAGPERPGFLHLASSCEIEGSIWYEEEAARPQPSLLPQVQLDPQTRLWGNLTVAGNLSLRADVYGHVAARSLVLPTAAGVFRNHLLDAQIDRTKLAFNFAGPLTTSNEPHEILVLFPDEAATDETSAPRQ
jgi:cytoskeletal protein CcmA (bactofilin family)